MAEERRIALAFPELRCTFGSRSIVPDISVFSWQRIPFDPDGEIGNVFKTHPDWNVEILSPDQNGTKVISNILHCLNHGTQLGWFVDPSEKIAIAFQLGQQPIELRGGDLLPVPAFLDLQLTVEQMFGLLKARSEL